MNYLSQSEVARRTGCTYQDIRDMVKIGFIKRVPVDGYKWPLIPESELPKIRDRQKRKRTVAPASEHRSLSCKRIFQLVAMLATGRLNQFTAINIAEKINETTEQKWSVRTVRRDLAILSEIGFVRIIPQERFSKNQSRLYEWVGTDTHSRVAVSAAENLPLPERRPETLESFLLTLPEMVEMDIEQRQLSESAARLIAVMETGDRRYLKAGLVFVMGSGWSLRLQGEPSAFDRAKPLSSIAREYERKADLVTV
jgi:hypothetical protein